MDKGHKPISKTEFRNLFSVLANGSSSECKEAKKELERLWHHQTKAFKKNAAVALDYIRTFDDIKKTENQAAFVSGLSLFFLVLGHDNFETLKNFTLKVIQNQNGHVREAMRQVTTWLNHSLVDRLHPFMFPEGKAMTPEQKNERSKAQIQYYAYVKEIESLMEKYDDGSENQTTYISELKPSVYKSLQMLWNDVTRGGRWAVDTPSNILKKRQEIESKLKYYLTIFHSDYHVEYIKEVIYDEEDQKVLTEIIALFDQGQDLIELNKVLEAVQEAWNYFPHKSLGGLSPVEKLLDYHKKTGIDKETGVN